MKRKLLIAAIIVTMLGGVGFFVTQGKSDVEVETYKVGHGNIKSFVEERATVKSKEQKVVHSKMTGEIMKLYVEIGDTIKTGDKILEMNAETTELEIKSLQAKLDALRAAYNEATKLPEKELINKATANIRSTEIALEKAQRDFENSEKLYNEGAISYESYKEAQDYLNMQQQALEIAKNDLAMLKKSTSENVKKQYDAQIAELEYQINILKNNRGYALVLAPNEGTVLETFVKEGAFLQRGGPIIELGDEKDLYLQLDVLVNEIADIKEGAEVIISSDDFEMKPLKGRVSKIYPKAFSKISDLGIEQKRVRVEVAFETQSELLKIGYEVNAKIVTATRNNVLLVSERALFDYEDGSYVYIVSDGKAQLKKIETGIEGEDMIEVLSGLKEGEQVVLNPDETLEDDVEIIIKDNQ